MIIRSRAPLRIGLAGGGTDIESFYSRYGGNVLNATIGRYAYTTLSEDTKTIFESADLQIVEQGDHVNHLRLHQAVYLYFKKKYCANKALHLKISTYVDAPIGSGLGSSSTLVVSMIKAFSEYLNTGWDDYQIADLAYRIERYDCKMSGGKQDQFSAAFGGLNYLEFYHDRTVVNSLRIKDWISAELEANLLLFSTGISRKSAEVIDDQERNATTEGASLEAMLALKTDAIQMKEAVLKGDFTNLISLMREGWEHKKRTSSAVADENLNSIYEKAIKSGASAGKISGAGGGGFFLFFVPLHRRRAVMKALEEFKGECSAVQLVQDGAQAWKL